VDEAGGRGILGRLSVARAAAFARPAEPAPAAPGAAPSKGAPAAGDVVCACGAVIVTAQRRRLFSEMTLCCASCGVSRRVTAR